MHAPIKPIPHYHLSSLFKLFHTHSPLYLQLYSYHYAHVPLPIFIPASYTHQGTPLTIDWTKIFHQALTKPVRLHLHHVPFTLHRVSGWDWMKVYNSLEFSGYLQLTLQEKLPIWAALFTIPFEGKMSLFLNLGIHLCVLLFWWRVMSTARVSHTMLMILNGRNGSKVHLLTFGLVLPWRRFWYATLFMPTRIPEISLFGHEPWTSCHLLSRPLSRSLLQILSPPRINSTYLRIVISMWVLSWNKARVEGDRKDEAFTERVSMLHPFMCSI